MTSSKPPGLADRRLTLDTSIQPAVLHLSGVWSQASGIPDPETLLQNLSPGADLSIEAGRVERWDTSIAAFVARLERLIKARGGNLHSEGLPAGALRLMKLIRQNTAPGLSAPPRERLFVRVGKEVFRRIDRVFAWFAMAGATFAAMVRFFMGRARVPLSDVVEQLHECGPRALPIVTLLSFLIGGITAFVGVIQLRMFGAEIYVADLVGMGMLLEMGALMTGIIMAGRAGAAFAAAIGTMQTNEEVDALQTLGFDPVEFLVMPRILALVLMTPLLTLYSDVLGILGGAFVGMTMLDISPATYFVQTGNAIHLADASKGLIKSVCFGAVIGFSGCLRGLECGRSAQSVGHATTSAVVTAIVLIVLADAFTTVLFFILRRNALMSAVASPLAAQIRALDLTLKYGERTIQNKLNFSVAKGDRFIIMGDSGCGKSTLLKHLIALYKPASGKIFYENRDLWEMTDDERGLLAQRFGVLYQSGALFSSMTLAENVALPITQYQRLPGRRRTRNRRVEIVSGRPRRVWQVFAVRDQRRDEKTCGAGKGHGARPGSAVS